MIESLGICGARDGDSYCPGDVIVERVVGGIAEAVCSLCSLEYAAPARPEGVLEDEKDWTETPDPWWQR